MNFSDSYVSREHHYSLGTVEETGVHYLSIPVTNGIADYEEYYALAPETYELFRHDPDAAAAFADECRRQEHDDLLILKPGWNRGIPM